MRAGILFICFAGMALVACRANEDRGPEIEQRTAALLSSSNVTLETLTNSCGANQAQDFFKVINNGTSSVKLSDITIKYWLDDTSGTSIVPAVSTGGCLTNSGGCFHPVTGVTASATSFSPACGPDPSHQANWEVTISNTDSTLVSSGVSWTNLQTGIHLANFANFVPGEASWFSPCLSGGSYVQDSHYAVYVKGNLVFSSGISTPSCRSPSGQQQLMSGHVPGGVATATLLGPMSPTATINLAVGLPVPDLTVLQNDVQQRSDPTSSTYRQFLSASQFASTFGASSADYQALTAWAQTNGLSIVKTYPNRLLLDVSGSVAAIERALYVNLFNYRGADGKVFYAPDREPSIDTATPVLFVSNLNNFFKLTPAAGTGSATLCTDNGGCYLGGDFRNAFASCTAMTGANQTIGILSGDGFSLGDLSAYAALSGIPNVPQVTTVFSAPSDPSYQACQPVQVGCNDANHTSCQAIAPNPCSSLPGNSTDTTTCQAACPADSGCATTGSACPGGFTAEMALDADMVLAMAPQISQIVIFEGAVSSDLIHSMATFTPKINQLSSSWGLGGDPNTVNGLLEIADQGQTLMFASGDSGAQSTIMSSDRGLDGLTYVGGTVLTTTNPPPNGRVTYSLEQAWNGSSGWIDSGNSQLGIPSAPIPAYQTGINMTANMGSTVFRNAPDVAMPAWDMEIVYLDAQQSIAGTSAAAPLWAGFMALANQESALNGLNPVGFANPTFYAMGKSPAIYGTVFNDIVGIAQTGSNDPDFPAVTGYDLITGWGSPKCAMIDQLASLSPLTVRQPQVIATTTVAPQGIAVDGTNVYWTDGRNAMKTDKAGGGGVVQIGVGPEQGQTLNAFSPIPIAIDGTNAYWMNEEVIEKVPLAGGTPVPLVPFTSGVPSLSSDGTNLFWTDNDLGEVLRLPIGGGTPTVLGQSAESFGSAIDTTNVYWTNTALRQIKSVPKVGGTVVTVADNLSDSPIRIAVSNGQIYFTIDQILKVSTQGGVVTTLETPSVGAALNAIAVDNANVYWTQGATGTMLGGVYRVPIGGGAVSLVAASNASSETAMGIALDNTFVYWTADSIAPLTGGRILRFPK